MLRSLALGLSLVRGGLVNGWKLLWGGTNEYAELIEPWEANSYGDYIEFEFTANAPGTGAQQVFSNTTGTVSVELLNTTGVITANYIDIDGATARTISGPAAVAGTKYTGTLTFNGDGVVLTVDGTDYTNVNVPELPTFHAIAATNTPSEYFNGTIHKLNFVNVSALQGVDVVQPDGATTYGEIPEITLTGDGEVSWSFVHAGTADTTHLFDPTGATTYFFLQGSTGNFWFKTDGGAIQTWVGALSNLSLGQHATARLTWTGSDVELFIDDVSQGVKTYAGTTRITEVGRSSSQQLQANAHLTDLVITDVTNSLTYNYPLTKVEGDVTKIENIDPTTGVIGDELVTNSTFDTDLTGWSVTDGSVSTIDWVAGTMSCVRTNQAVAETTLSELTDTSKFYLLTFDVLASSNAGAGTIYFTVGGVTTPTTGGTAVGSHSFLLKPTAAGAKLSLLAGGVGGLEFTLDNVSFVEYPHGEWQNVDSDDFVSLPLLSQRYSMNDGPGRYIVPIRNYTNSVVSSYDLTTTPVVPATREDIAFFSGGETGAIDYDGTPFGDDVWDSSQVWGPDGYDSVANGTEGVYVDDTYTRAGGKAIRFVLKEEWGQRGGRWRNECRSAVEQNFEYGDTHWVGWSIYIPDDVAGNNQRAVNLTNLNMNTVNFHHPAGAWGIHTYDGQWRLNVNYLAANFDEWVWGAATLGVWHDFVVKIKTHLTAGVMEIWHQNNGGGYTKVIDRQNVRTAENVGDFLSPKIGIYRGADGSAFGTAVGVPQFEQVFDEYRDTIANGGSFDDVKPGDA